MEVTIYMITPLKTQAAPTAVMSGSIATCPSLGVCCLCVFLVSTHTLLHLFRHVHVGKTSHQKYGIYMEFTCCSHVDVGSPQYSILLLNSKASGDSLIVNTK